VLFQVDLRLYQALQLFFLKLQIQLLFLGLWMLVSRFCLYNAPIVFFRLDTLFSIFFGDVILVARRAAMSLAAFTGFEVSGEAADVPFGFAATAFDKVHLLLHLILRNQ